MSPKRVDALGFDFQPKDESLASANNLHELKMLRSGR